MKTIALFDFANVSMVMRFGMMSKKIDVDSIEDWKYVFIDQFLIYLANYITALNIDEPIICLEHKSWRKDIYPLYKENRKEAKEKDEMLEIFFEARSIVIDFLKKYTNIKIIQVEGAEGDDIIAVLTQYLYKNNKITIISNDRDFHQLLRFKNVRIFDTIKKNYKLARFDKVEYYEKLIKGDAGDNIPSAYPRIKKELIESIAINEDNLKKEFEKNKVQQEKQKEILNSLFKYFNIPVSSDLDKNLNIAKMIFEEVKNKVKKAKEFNEYNDNKKLKETHKFINNIKKMAKEYDLTESKLLNKIIDFEESFKRNKKLIDLDINNIPEFVVKNIIYNYENYKKEEQEMDYIKFCKKYKLKEFLFSQESEILCNI